jgi:hypothetical protein
MIARLARLIVAVYVLTTAVATRAEAPPPLEYQVKASYIYNFVQFIDWPKDVFDDGKFYVCVSGTNRFGGALDVLAGERVDGREIAIRRLMSSVDARSQSCHVLFLGADDVQSVAPVVAERGLLTIGETHGFTERGGIINLVAVGGNIRFRINHQAARQSGLIVSSRLLNLAMGAER